MLIMHLAEDKIKKLPEGRVLGHAFVAMDEVMTTTEGDFEHFVVGHAGMGIGDNILGTD